MKDMIFVENRVNLGSASKRTDYGVINGKASNTRAIMTAWVYADADKGSDEMRLGDAISAKRTLEETLGEDHHEEILTLEAEKKALGAKYAEDLNNGYNLVTDDLYKSYLYGADSVEFNTTRGDVLYNAVARWIEELGFTPKHRSVEAIMLAMGENPASTNSKAKAQALGQSKDYTGKRGKAAFKKTVTCKLADEMGQFLPQKKYGYIRKSIIDKIQRDAEKKAKRSAK